MVAIWLLNRFHIVNNGRHRLSYIGCAVDVVCGAELRLRGTSTEWFLAIGVAIFLTWMIGLMPFTGVYTADRWNMVSWYVLYAGKHFTFSWDETNYLFDNFYAFIATKRLPPSFFFLPVSAIYFCCILWACRKFFSHDTLLAFAVYLGAFSTLSYGVNGAKAGSAAALFLVAIAYRENRPMAALFCFLSLGFHHSMFVPIGMFVLTYFVKKREYYLYAGLASCLLAMFGTSAIQEWLATLTDDSSYISSTDAKQVVSGFRPDFILYSAVPIYLGYYFHRYYDIESDDTYDFLLNLYTGTNALFIICSFGSYINRIAYLSWLMYPIVLIYPFLKYDLGENHYRYLRYAAYGHLGFTLFMWAIGK